MSATISKNSARPIVPLVAPYLEEALKVGTWPGIAVAVLSGALAILKSVEA